MIERYHHPLMTPIWSDTGRFERLLRVEVAVLQTLAQHKVIPLTEKQVNALVKNIKIDLTQIRKYEAKTQHDVLAFVHHVAEQCGPEGRWIHYGLTSSDVLDTALSLQIKTSVLVLQAELRGVLHVLQKLLQTHGDHWILGRTHGVPAQPLRLSHLFALWGVHLGEAFEGFLAAAHTACVAKVSGAVGNYAVLSPKIESDIAKRLGLTPVRVASQVVGRHLHAAVSSSLAILMAVVEKIAVDIRLRHQHGEICEGFSAGQMGSSAMPHKKNPIACENFSGMARLARGYAAMTLENVGLWLERDISHSSVERVAFPDLFHVAAYTLARLQHVLSHLVIDPSALERNLKSALNVYYSQWVTGQLLEKEGKEEAYEQVQKAAFDALQTQKDFLQLVAKRFPEIDLHACTLELWDKHTDQPIKHFTEVLKRVGERKL